MCGRSTVSREELARKILDYRDEVAARIAELEAKDRAGTIGGDEGNELDITREQHDFPLYDEVAARIRSGEFSTLGGLIRRLQDDMGRAEAGRTEHGGTDHGPADVSVMALSGQAYARIVTLDTILFLLEREYGLSASI